MLRNALPLLLVCILSLSSHADKRNSYSYLGLGVDLLSYSESDDNVLNTGIRLETEMTGSNLAQRSGGYMSYNDNWGFYITSGSSIGTTVNDETWSLNDTEVQENSFTMKRSELMVLVSRNISKNHYLLFGGSYNDTSFSRFSWSFNEQNDYAIDKETGTFTEYVSQLFAYVGYEYNEFYTSTRPGWRTQFQFLAGLPLYSSTLNTRFDTEHITTSFDGYLLRATPSLAYQLNKNFMLGMSLDISYNLRDKDEWEATITDGNGNPQKVKQALPENTLLVIQPAFTAYWSF